MELLARLFADAPVPRLVNAVGQEVVFSEARYHVTDGARVAKMLGTTFEPDSAPGNYVWLEGSSLAGRLALKNQELCVQCDSRERLQTLKMRLTEPSVPMTLSPCASPHLLPGLRHVVRRRMVGGLA